MPWRAASARRTPSPSTPSGTEMAVTSEQAGSSGEKSSRPSSRTRPRTIAPSSSVRAHEASTPVFEDHVERGVEPEHQRDRGGVRALRPVDLRLARPLPVEVEAGRRRPLDALPRARGDAREGEAGRAHERLLAARSRRRRGPTRRSRAGRHRGSRRRRPPAARRGRACARRSPGCRRSRRSRSRCARRRPATRRGVGLDRRDDLRRRRGARRASKRSVSTSAPYAFAIAIQRSPKLPAETHRTRSPGESRFA